MMNPKELATALLDYGAFKISMDPLFTWTSGIKSPVYCDLRSLNSNVELRRQITATFAEMVNPDEIDVVAGTSTAGISWAAWLAEILGKPMVYVRGSAKEHGTKKRVEGRIDSGQRVLVVEDLISTGGSSAETVRALREDVDAQVSQILAINTYGMVQAKNIFEELGVHLMTLTSFQDIAQVAMERGELTPEQVELLGDFGADPAGWSERHGLS